MTAVPKNKKELANLVDHTLLKPEATDADVTALVEEAAQLGTFSVCVSPTMVKHAKAVAKGRVKICTVVGFPSGKVVSSIKAAEAKQAVKDGADEVDMVIDVGRAKEHNFKAVEDDIAAVRKAIPDTLLKVIIESAALSDGEIIGTSEAAANAKADFVKTATGFHPAGGASPHAVEIMSRTVKGRAGAVLPQIGVKASGAVRTLADAKAVIEKGATRLGLSGTEAVLKGFDDPAAATAATDAAGY